jgi:hypothetical protein
MVYTTGTLIGQSGISFGKRGGSHDENNKQQHVLM